MGVQEQEEEVEVLESIYEGDEAFKIIDATTYQYKLGEDGDLKSFVLEVKWPEDYPEELPVISMNTFYNKHILVDIKKNIVNALQEQAEQLVGCAMTYTLFEYVKENVDTLLEDQPDAPQQVVEEVKSDSPVAELVQKVKKEHFTKAQKRKMFNRMTDKGEMPRGWDWVDIVKHLSQLGRREEVN